jgi:hypothetical protein
MAIMDRPFPLFKLKVSLVDRHIAGTISVSPSGFLAIALNHEANINATNISR